MASTRRFAMRVIRPQFVLFSFKIMLLYLLLITMIIKICPINCKMKFSEQEINNEREENSNLLNKYDIYHELNKMEQQTTTTTTTNHFYDNQIQYEMLKSDDELNLLAADSSSYTNHNEHARNSNSTGTATTTTTTMIMMGEPGSTQENPLSRVGISFWEALRLGMYRRSLPIVILLCFAYSLVFIIGIVGNSFVVTIVCRSPKMRTVTNIFIANLALADILVLVICLPATLIGNILVRK